MVTINHNSTAALHLLFCSKILAAQNQNINSVSGMRPFSQIACLVQKEHINSAGTAYKLALFSISLSSMCVKKWKQLSRLQRSLILFILVLLFICGFAAYPTVTEHLRGRAFYTLNISLGWLTSEMLACCQGLLNA